MQIITPPLQQIQSIQDREDKYYWSGLAATLFRANGFIGARPADIDKIDARQPVIATRGLGPDLASKLLSGGVVLFEGPLNPETARLLGVSIVDWEQPRVDVVFWERQSIGGLKYPVEFYYDAASDAVRPVVEPARWTNQLVYGQFIEGEEWTPLMTARLPDGRSGPILLRRGSLLLCGLPIFDVGVRLGAFPPLASKYRSRDDLTGHSPLFAKIVELMLSTSQSKAPAPIVRVKRWPAGYHSAFSIRHDYDRKISGDSEKALLEYYASRGLKCSMGLLSYLTPPLKLEDFISDGHEIQLHSHAGTEEDFAISLLAIQALCHHPIEGMTIHGGRTSPGFLGDTHYGWAARAGLKYAEMFAKHDIQVFPVPRIGPDSIPSNGNILGFGRHLSLDTGMKPGQNRFGELSKSLPALIHKQYVVLMNHPDINRRELIALLDSLDFSGVWLVTQGQAVEWFRTTHFEAQVEVSQNTVRVSFPDEVLAGAEISITWSDGVENIVVVYGRQMEFYRELGDQSAGLDGVESERSMMKNGTS